MRWKGLLRNGRCGCFGVVLPALRVHRQTAPIHDPNPQAIVEFLRLPGDTVYSELVAPDTAASPLQAALAHKHPLHHVCYSAGDIEKTCADLETSGLTLICHPVEAIAFGGRRVPWLMGRDRLLVELVEEGASLVSTQG
jgi:methylmalonyl-CoA/ethylmalonyl-CoA epimerase